jgi:hypothetical protein
MKYAAVLFLFLAGCGGGSQIVAQEEFGPKRGGTIFYPVEVDTGIATVVVDVPIVGEP